MSSTSQTRPVSPSAIADVVGRCAVSLRRVAERPMQRAETLDRFHQEHGVPKRGFDPAKTTSAAMKSRQTLTERSVEPFDVGGTQNLLFRKQSRDFLRRSEEVTDPDAHRAFPLGLLDRQREDEAGNGKQAGTPRFARPL